MDPIWRVRESTGGDSENSVAAVSGSMDPLVQALLAKRGLVEPETLQKFLYPKVSELKNPFLILNMESAANRLADAFARKEKVCIYADFDLDGTSGLALLSEGLTAMGFEDLVLYQPKRLSDGYGFHAAVVEDLHRQGVSLIVTVDVGITSLEAAQRARDLGVDVIITDHHLPGEVLPKAFAVVNPNQAGDPSGLGYLCGAGVAFYFLRAVLRVFHDRDDLPSVSLDLRSLLDFFTIATLTDMVPLVEDNRVLVKQGLAVLAQTKRPGLRALLEHLHLPETLSSQDVAIRFAPKLNALSRMESGILPIDIMLCKDSRRAVGLVESVMKNNDTRVQLQGEADKLAMELLKDWSQADFVFVASEHFHRGVIGLIATKLSQAFHRPAYVGSLQPEEQVIVGSARLPNGSEDSLVQAMTFAHEAFNRYGGHSAAAGFELRASAVDGLISKLAEYYAGHRAGARVLEHVYDLEVPLEDVQDDFLRWYDVLGPFGTGFEAPILRFNNIRLDQWNEVRGGHLKLKMRAGRGYWDGMLFSPSRRQREILEAGALVYDILGELQWNFFAGRRRMQVLIKDLRVRS